MAEQEEKPKFNRDAYRRARRIFAYMRPYRGRYIFGMVLLFLTSVVFLVFTLLIRYLVDSTGIQENVEVEVPFGLELNDIGLALLGLLVFQAVVSYARVYLFIWVTEHTLADVRKAVFRNLISLPMTFFAENSSGELNSRMASDITQIQDAFTTTLSEIIRQVLIIIGSIVVLFALSPKLTFTLLGVVPVMAVAAVVFGRRIRTLSRGVQDQVAKSTNIVSEVVTGIINVKAFTNEHLENKRFGAAVGEIRKYGVKLGVWRGVFAAFIIAAMFGAISGVFWYAMAMVQDGELTYGEFFASVMLAMTIGFSIGGLAEFVTSLLKAIGATERVMDLAEEPREEVQRDREHKVARFLSGDLVVQGLNFRYPTRPDVHVLKDVSFEVHPGQQVAIVGPSGSGKSTITALILQFYKASSGSILFDNKPASEYDLSELRDHMAIVPQEVLLFGGSIRDNIAYGKPDATNEEIEAAALQANAHDFILGFPEGYDTLVGERGVQLSGGQRQRIAIARAVLKNPTILILDEATSSLDSESERLVQDALDKLMEGRTSIVIAHRLSTIRGADQILVLENGVLKERGTHDELVALDAGIYKHLCQLQFT
ncbi:MAG: ABC transporter ATP-binding protein [Flavobacteriales bacterium]